MNIFFVLSPNVTLFSQKKMTILNNKLITSNARYINNSIIPPYMNCNEILLLLQD